MTNTEAAGHEASAPVRELQQSILLLALTASSMGAYLALAVLAVRIVTAAR